ncbi:MAG: alpha/beta hydrolase [Pseudomonadota bacterium]
MTADQNAPLQAPNPLAIIREARVGLDMAKMLLPLTGAQLRPRLPAQRTPIMVLPGFGSDDRYTLPLRHFLKRNGYRAEGWGLGMNLAGVNLEHSLDDLRDTWEVDARDAYNGEASVPYLCDRVVERVAARAESYGEPMTLIGWSLGGYLAREAARDLPTAVKQVITLGSPTVGGPKYTAAAGFFRKRQMDLDWIEREITKREARPIMQPITAIVSRSDGVVGWGAAQDHFSPNVRHVEIDASHLGMGFNPAIWREIIAVLGSESSID